jgi:hypothetical protein
MIPVETVPGIGSRGYEWGREVEEGNLYMIYLIRCLRTFVNATIYPHPVQQ